MIDEDEMDEIVERAMALGADYAVLADLLRLIAEVRRLRASAEAEDRLIAKLLRFWKAEAALEKSRAGRPSLAAEIRPEASRVFNHLGR